MPLYGLNNEQFITGRELGKGGEGAVFELQNYSSFVLKKYNEPLTADKIAKLRFMVSVRSPAVEAYAAWPANLVLDGNGTICGFVMKKLSGYAPLHVIFSPLDRKKLFPDKGYNFLVHVARNLATAFFKLHEAGFVVGDVNEGNVLVSSSGLVTFIDCDSFQVKGANNYYLCEVGVPRYTPPEVLNEKAFDQVVRTVNTDSFSLAVLIFQLLFLGRHPFAGKNKQAGDMDEEKAIRQRQFAYSLENKRKKLHPPNDSFPITHLPENVIGLFHRAFEQDERPTPGEWVKVLDLMLSEMMTCSESRLHTYPSKVRDCPWCHFKENRGILYFLDDTHTHATAALKDIEFFVNGFNPEKLELKKWSPLPFPQLSASAIDRKFYSCKAMMRWSSAAVILLCFLLYIVFYSSAWIFIFAIIFPVLIYKFSGWTKKIKFELVRRLTEYKRLSETLERMIREHDNPPDLTVYLEGLKNLNKYVYEFRNLPLEFDRRKNIMEEQLYNEYLDNYLKDYNIEHFTIPTFGALKKSALKAAGIVNAADISKLQTVKVPGIGQKNLQVLMDWRRQMSSGFVYMPESDRTAKSEQKVAEEIAAVRVQLEKQIRKEYQSVNFIKMNISNRANVLEKQIKELTLRTYQADIDLVAFRKFAA
jgi:DNA-binding helix-hairpin-helix protein with protein kinase domain